MSYLVLDEGRICVESSKQTVKDYLHNNNKTFDVITLNNTECIRMEKEQSIFTHNHFWSWMAGQNEQKDKEIAA